MLVLSRNENEVIVLSDRDTGEVIAKITVRDSSRKQVRLAIDAPQSVLVDRYEIYEKKRQERENEFLRSA